MPFFLQRRTQVTRVVGAMVLGYRALPLTINYYNPYLVIVKRITFNDTSHVHIVNESLVLYVNIL